MTIAGYFDLLKNCAKKSTNNYKPLTVLKNCKGCLKVVFAFLTMSLFEIFEVLLD